MANRFEYITRIAKAPAASWSNKERVSFHYFNPNGLIRTKQVLDQLIDSAVEAGKCKSGAIIAYGGLNYYYPDQLRALYDLKHVSWVKYITTVQGLRRDIEKAREFLAGLES